MTELSPGALPIYPFLSASVNPWRIPSVPSIAFSVSQYRLITSPPLHNCLTSVTDNKGTSSRNRNVICNGRRCQTSYNLNCDVDIVVGKVGECPTNQNRFG